MQYQAPAGEQQTRPTLTPISQPRADARRQMRPIACRAALDPLAWGVLFVDFNTALGCSEIWRPVAMEVEPPDPARSSIASDAPGIENVTFQGGASIG